MYVGVSLEILLNTGGPEIGRSRDAGGPQSRWSRHVVGRTVLDTGEHSAGERSASPPFSFPLIHFFPFLLLNSGQKKYLTVLLDLEKDVDVNQWSQID